MWRFTSDASKHLTWTFEGPVKYVSFFNLICLPLCCALQSHSPLVLFGFKIPEQRRHARDLYTPLPHSPRRRTAVSPRRTQGVPSRPSALRSHRYLCAHTRAKTTDSCLSYLRYLCSLCLLMMLDFGRTTLVLVFTTYTLTRDYCFIYMFCVYTCRCSATLRANASRVSIMIRSANYNRHGLRSAVPESQHNTLEVLHQFGLVFADMTNRPCFSSHF